MDILEFIREPDYVSPEWPEGYWPAPDEETDADGWQRTIDQLRPDNQSLQDIVADPGTDPTAPLPAGEEYNIVREILAVPDHNGCEIGEFGILRQVMSTWPPHREP